MRFTLFLMRSLMTVLGAGCRRDPVPAQQTLPSDALAEAGKKLSPLPSRPLSRKAERLRDIAARKAEDIRELKFTVPVGMTELTGWEYGTRASEMASIFSGEDLKSISRLAAAGGFLPEGTDLGALAATFAAFSASATYSPFDKQVLLIDKFHDESLLTHELTHALQDQHFDLLKLWDQRPFNFDRGEAIFAVVEGDAMNVQRRSEMGDLYARLSLAQIQRQEDSRFDEYRKSAGLLFQPLITETFIFRYRDGAKFIEAVRRSGGEAAVNALFKNPPLSTEQILHFDKFLSGERPREVNIDDSPLVATGWHPAAATTLGEIGIKGVLMSGNNPAQSERAAAGWGGDRAFLFERTGRAPLFVWTTGWDTENDAQEFFKAYRHLESGNTELGLDSVVELRTEVAGWTKDGISTVIRRRRDSVLILRGDYDEVFSSLKTL